MFEKSVDKIEQTFYYNKCEIQKKRKSSIIVLEHSLDLP